MTVADIASGDENVYIKKFSHISNSSQLGGANGIVTVMVKDRKMYHFKVGFDCGIS